MVNRKVRRHSGRVTPWMPNYPKRLFLDYDLEPQIFWDDWVDYRDSFRINRDRKMIRSRFMWGSNIKKWNERLKLLISRRKAKKGKVEEKKVLLILEG